MLTLGQFRAAVRTKTRHTSDTVRLTNPTLDEIGNRVYRELRAWLANEAPTHPSNRIATSGHITIPDPTTGALEIELRSDTYAYSKLFLVEYRHCQSPEVWLPADPASMPDRNQAAGSPYTFREEAGCLYFGPDWIGNNTDPVVFRVKFFETPPALADTDAAFKIPAELERPLIYKAAAEVHDNDGDTKEGADKDEKATKMLEAAKLALKPRKGVHARQGGLVRRRGY